MVALHLGNCTVKAYLCNQGDTISSFLSRLACWILSLADKYSITLIPIYIPTHLNVEANYLSWGRLHPGWHLFHHIAQAAFKFCGLPEMDLLALSCSMQCWQYYTLENPLPLWALRLNAFNHPWMYQVCYVFPSHALVPPVLSMFLAEHVTGQFRLLFLVVPCWMEIPGLPTFLNMLEDVLAVLS